jgi:hypothetical protein
MQPRSAQAKRLKMLLREKGAVILRERSEFFYFATASYKILNVNVDVTLRKE